MITEKEIIEAGKFLKPHGLKGELNVILEYDADILEEEYPIIVELDGIYVPFYIESIRPKGHFSSLIKIEGIDSIDEAKKFVNKIFYLRRSDVADFLNVTEEEIESDTDLIGFKVYDKTFGYIGTVEDVDTSSENVLLLVRPEVESDAEGTKDVIYIPLSEDLIEEVTEDKDNGISEIHLDLPQGLLDLN